MLAAGDPVASGFVSSLARPGGNVTGNAFFGEELQMKQLEILIEATGAIKRLALVGHEYYRQAPRWLRQVERLKTAAASRGFELQDVYVQSSLNLDQAFGALVRDRVEGAIVEGNAAMELSADAVGALVLKHRLPVIMTWRDSARGGVPLTYGVKYSDLTRKGAVYVARILDGAKPADLPVELPTRFDFTINLHAADAIGMKIPRSLILRADELIP
jgi:putative ABC transport system substrate-binding protein